MMLGYTVKYNWVFVVPICDTNIWVLIHTCMTTKLTLTIEDSVINSAKEYARQKRKKPFGCCGELFKIDCNPEDQEEKLSPKVLKMMG